MLAMRCDVRKNPHVMNISSPSSRSFLGLASIAAAAASLFLSSCSTPQASMPSVAIAPSVGGTPRSSEASRPGLGTQAGYERHDAVSRTEFYRKSSSPDAVASFYYNDEPGAKAMADLLGGGTRRTGMMDMAGGRLRAGLVSYYGNDIFPYLDARTRQIVMGNPGQSYQIRLENRTDHRQEVIVSVDSLNVLNGKVAGYSQRGYIIDPKGKVDINGFRVNDEKSKSFTFSSVANSKAAKQGQARNVGVIGLAVFEEDEAKAKMMLRKEQFQRDDASAFPVSGR